MCEPCPKLKSPITFVRKRQRRELATDPTQLAGLHRAYCSGLQDGLNCLANCETLYPDAFAARYALGYSRGRAQSRRRIQS